MSKEIMPLSFASPWVDPRDIPEEPTGTQGEWHSFGTVNSRYSGHPRDRDLVSVIGRVRNNGSLFQSNVCNLISPGI